MKSSNEIKSVFLVEMGCPKLTYYQNETPLKVVYRADEQGQKHVQRFLSVDPMAEKYPDYSPYAYCHNNPIILTDPDGKDDYYDENGKYIYTDTRTSNDIRLIDSYSFKKIASKYNIFDNSKSNF